MYRQLMKECWSKFHRTKQLVSSGGIWADGMGGTNRVLPEAACTVFTHVHVTRVERAFVAIAVLLVRTVRALFQSIATSATQKASTVDSTVSAIWVVRAIIAVHFVFSSRTVSISVTDIRVVDAFGKPGEGLGLALEGVFSARAVGFVASVFTVNSSIADLNIYLSSSRQSQNSLVFSRYNDHFLYR